MTPADATEWPELPYGAWAETRDTLHLWTQVVGKIRLTQTPWLNHSWHVTLYPTARGLTTSPIPYRAHSFQIDFDFIDHTLWIQTSDGGERRIHSGQCRSPNSQPRCSPQWTNSGWTYKSR